RLPRPPASAGRAVAVGTGANDSRVAHDARGSQSRAHEVLIFWFGQRPYTPASVAQHMRLWFGDPNAPELTPQTDEMIAERFGVLMRSAAQGGLSSWESSPRRRLALVLLLDQFPRNV